MLEIWLYLYIGLFSSKRAMIYRVYSRNYVCKRISLYIMKTYGM